MAPALNIGIAGAGIGGLSIAALLSADGHRVAIFDKFEKPMPVGSGLVVQPVGLDVLQVLGARKYAESKGVKLVRMLGREVKTNRRVLDVWYDQKTDQAKYGLAIHRASLFEAILRSAKSTGVDIIPGSEVVSAQDGKFFFAGGRPSDRFDLLIDASGARSNLSPIKSKQLPYGALWAAVPWLNETGLPDDYLSQRYRRADRMAGIMPSGSLPGQKQQMATIFWSLQADSYQDWLLRPINEWKAEAHDLWPEYSQYLESIHSHDQMIWARYSHGTLKKPYGNGIAYIGDSAHRSSPQLGQGANMALLDALALTLALRQAPVNEALVLYAKARRNHVGIYQAMSWAFTPQYQSDSRVLPLLRDNVLFPLSQIPPLPRILSSLVRGELVRSIKGIKL
jgi:2-polyprenyl-6-methoxyphenol hydroxylase-like FAD-dependent oxidoreductase